MMLVAVSPVIFILSLFWKTGLGIQVLVDASYSFDEYLAKFDKSYSDPEEYHKRRSIFQQNLQTIVAHNTNADLSKGGYVLGLNPFTDLEPGELARGYDKLQSSTRLSTLLSSNDHRQPHVPTELALGIDDDVVNLPPSVDWRTAGVTTPVKSQGGCGSCWAFASTAVLESHIAIQTGTLFSLSEQELVSCAPNPRNCGGQGGCAGATAEIAFDFAMEKGMVQEWDFGYQSNKGETVACKLADSSSMTHPFLKGSRNMMKDAGRKYFKGAVASINGFYTLPTNNYKVLMNVVAKYGPVAVSVACLPWQLYHGGVFYAPLNTTRATDVDHLVVLEGYGTDEVTKEDYWLVRNSWGPLWGEHGYVRLLRVDPATLDNPDDDCGMDITPSDGVACTKDHSGHDVVPPPAKICGNSGILYDSSIPLGGHLL